MTKSTHDPIQHRKVYLIGGGIASLASAAYFIRDSHINPAHITLFEELNIAGGSLDGSGSPDHGYSMRGGRMLNFSYLCTYDLFSFIPSLGDPGIMVLDEIKAFNKNIANAFTSSCGERRSNIGCFLDGVQQQRQS